MRASDDLIVMKRGEVIVVGAGPAGIVAAIATRRWDLQATVPDTRKLSINKFHSHPRFAIPFLLAVFAVLA